MTLFKALGGDITLFSNDGRALYFMLLDADGEPQDLDGKDFVFVGRHSNSDVPLVQLDMQISGDRKSAVAPIMFEQAAILHGAAAYQSVSYDAVDVTDGGRTTRWTGRISFAISPNLGGASSPLWVDLPWTEVLASAQVVAVSELGPQGADAWKGLARQGLIDAPTIEAMDARYAQAGAPFAAAAAGSAEASALAQAAAAARAADADQAAARAELAEEAVLAGADAQDNYGVALAAAAEGALFRVFADDGTIKTYRKVDGLGVEKFDQESSAVAALSRDQGDTLAKRTSRPSPPMADGFMQPIVDSPYGPVDYIDLVHMRRRMVGVPQPVPPMLADGWIKTLIAGDDPENDDPVMFHDGLRDAIGFPRPLIEPKPSIAHHGGFPTLQQLDGSALAGIYWDRHYQLQGRRLSGPIIMGDDNQIDQLFDLIEGQYGDTVVQRQLTFTQHGVAGFEVVYWPTDDLHGLIRISVRDQNLITSRHKVRYAVWPRAVHYQPSVPTKMLYFVKLGQSLAVGAGSYDSNPSGVSGPQTIRPSSSLRYAPWTHRNLCPNGGTIPHQGDLNGLHIDATYGYAYNVPIDPARIATLVPMVEGLGEAGADEDGGWRRESTLSAMAAQLNAAHNYNGSVYIAGASYGFGSTPFQNLLWDGVSLQQSALNALAGAAQAKALCDAQGIALEVHTILNHGQANQSDTTYKARLEGWWPVWKAAVEAISEQVGAQQLWIDQNTAARGTFAEAAYSAIAQAEFVTENADVHFLCPNYFTDFETDQVHQKAPEYQWSGEHDGEVIADWLIRGEEAVPMMTSATWSGATMRQVFSHPIMIDPVNVVLGSSALGAGHANLNGATRSVSSARIDPANPTDLLLRLSSAIPTDAVEVARQAYGNQTTPSPPSQGWGGGPSGGGQRSMLRRADWGERFGVVSGRPLYAFVPIQQISATQE